MGAWIIMGLAAWMTTQACAHEEHGVDESSARGLGAAQSSVCVAEDMNADVSAEQPRTLSMGSTLVGRVCEDDVDVFLVNTADSTGALVNVEIERLQGVGELEVRVTGTDGTQFPSQGPRGVEQNISFLATGETYMLMVNVVANLPAELATGRAYAATVQYLPRSTRDCCSSGDGPGCGDDGVLTCLCQLDNACCRDSFDSTCVAEARSGCDLTCGSSPPENDCCTVSSTGGCAASEVNDCVCGIDPYCCVGGFDENCVNVASNQCAAACSRPEAEAR